MKLFITTAVATVAGYGGEPMAPLSNDNQLKSLGGAGQRYLYDDPICPTVGHCKGHNGCDGKIYRAKTGTIRVENYVNKFNCLWEIKGAPGSRVKITIAQGDGSWGIESHNSCGYDRLHIQSGAKNETGQFDKFGRFCSHGRDQQKLHNALLSVNSPNGVKITNKEWQAGGVELDTNHLRIGFDTDNQGTGAGFKINYEIVGQGEEAVFEDVSESLSSQLEEIFTALTFDQLELSGLSAAAHERIKFNMQRHHDNLFDKFNALMGRCDQSSSMHVDVSAADLSDPKAAKQAWESLMISSFEVCDLPITRNGYEASSWKRRIDKYFARLHKLLGTDQN